MTSTKRFLPLILLSLSTWACDTANATTPSPAPATSTEDFAGTFAQSGLVIHTFTVGATGEVQITLTSVAPLATMGLGVAIAPWDGVNCGAATGQNSGARNGTTALKGTAAAGNYCIRVFDSGNVPEGGSVDYTIQVKHP